MSAAALAAAAAGDSLSWVEREGQLSALYEPALSALVLRRGLSLELAEEATRALEQPTARLLLSVAPTGQGRDQLGRALAPLSLLAADVFHWVELLADLVGCELVGVRLARVTEAMCPRFHVDRVTVRVVSTYVGAGTELVADGALDRRLLGHAAGGVADESSGLLRRAEAVTCTRAGDVVLLKGEAWPGNAGRGAVHRSPAASAAQPRLVMTLDPLA